MDFLIRDVYLRHLTQLNANQNLPGISHGYSVFVDRFINNKPDFKISNLLQLKVMYQFLLVCVTVSLKKEIPKDSVFSLKTFFLHKYIKLRNVYYVLNFSVLLINHTISEANGYCLTISQWFLPTLLLFSINDLKLSF